VVGISRATVAGIASGKRPDYEARIRARMEDELPLGPLARCAGCGGLVYMPCRLCRVRALQDRRHELLRGRRKKLRELALRRLLLAIRREHLKREARDSAMGRAG
jgi:hypothetical protein